METLSDTLLAWQTIEEFCPNRVRYLGISNVNLNNLELLYDLMRIKPAFVQNRFYASTSFDTGLRKFCVEHGIIYQAFWTLTKNPLLLNPEPVSVIAGALGTSKHTALYCLILGLENMVVLNGTSSADRMKSDLDDLSRCRTWIVSSEHQDLWYKLLTQFKGLIGDE